MIANQSMAVRIAALTMGCALALSVGTAVAQDDAGSVDMRATRMAYQTAMKCFVANGHASSERKRAGDAQKAGHYEAMARQSFDVAYNAGEKLGLTDDQVKRDLDFTQEIELPRFISDQNYLLSVAATCKAVGLM